MSFYGLRIEWARRLRRWPALSTFVYTLLPFLRPPFPFHIPHVYVCACGKAIRFEPLDAPEDLRELRCEACKRARQ